MFDELSFQNFEKNEKSEIVSFVTSCIFVWGGCKSVLSKKPTFVLVFQLLTPQRKVVES